MNVVGYILVMRIHEFDDDKCEVLLSYCILVIFYENESKVKKFDFNDFEWIDEVVRLS